MLRREFRDRDPTRRNRGKRDAAGLAEYERRAHAATREASLDRGDHRSMLSDDADVAAFRSALCAAVRSTLAAGLGLLGVSAPESM